MNDRDVEAQPGDNYQPQTEGEPLERPAEATPLETKPLEIPPKADVARSDQARRARPSRPSATPAARDGTPAAPPPSGSGARRRSVVQARPIAEPGSAGQAHQVAAPTAEPTRLTAPHPLSQLRRETRGGGPGRSFGLRGLGGLSGLIPRHPGAGPGGSRPGRPRLGRPSMRGVFAFAGLTATFAVVAALLVTLPTQPTSPSPTGSVYGITWHTATKPPTAKMDFGPFFTTLDNQLLMLGTTGTTTTVWASTDGSTWTQLSGSGAFAIGGRRFVAQGLSDDGQGGLVVIGNSLGSSPTDVIATAWHSRDGSTWTPMQVASGAGQEMIAGVASRPGAVVAAGNGVAWLSTDGLTWSPEILPGVSTATGTYMPRAVGSWNGGFVIIGLSSDTKTTRSAAWYSSTGRDWKLAGTSLDGFDVRGIAGLNGTIVAVGVDLSATAPGLAASWSSTDGNTWTKTTAPTDLSTVALDGVANVGGSLVAFGAPAPATTSAAASAGPTLPGSTPQPAAAEVVWVSDDGVNWIPIASAAAPLDHARMASIGTRVVMIGGSSSGLGLITGNLVMGPTRPPATESPPPAVFALKLQVGNTPMIVDVTKDFKLGPVTTSKDRFFTFATGPTGTSVFSSPDGSLWSRELTPDLLTASGVTGRPVILQAIPDGQGGIIAAGKVTNTSGDNGMIWHMTAAGAWTQAQFEDDAPPEFSSITAGPDGFVASSDVAGGSPIMYSTDGNTWQAGSIAVGNGFALSVATYRYGYVAVGTDPARKGATTAWTSPDGRTWTLRTDWHLPPNVTALFGTGTTLVAPANTAVAAAPSSSPSAKPTPTPAAPVQSTTWWWSASGVVWQQSGLQTSVGDWAVVNGRILVLSAPAKSTGNWTAWSSSDGTSWQRPTSESITFAGSQTCAIASIGNRVVIVGWENAGALKDYFGQFDSQ
ncbi:MAG TPA: hypothetical protein VGE81_11690 [Candidatus Limnocylindrales bacterium]